MTNDEFKQVMEDFATRIRLLGQDFAHLEDEFGAYEDEASCAYCGKKGELDETCEHCRAEFCADCWGKAHEAAQAAQARKAKP